jgi:hypothetical protein
MSASARLHLSSRLTYALKTAPIAVWLAVIFGFAWMLPRLGAATPPSDWIVLLLLVPPLLLLPLVIVWGSRLRAVATDGDNLLVTLATRRVVAVPLTLVIDVREWRDVDLRTINVTFDRATEAGRSVRFLAPTRFKVPRGTAHPVVLALRGTIDVAQSVTTLSSETRAPAPASRELATASG